jgi:hypothetical protein
MKKIKRDPNWPADYVPGNNRFADWSFGEDSNVIWQDTDQQLVPDPDNVDPNVLADLPAPSRPRGAN